MAETLPTPTTTPVHASFLFDDVDQVFKLFTSRLRVDGHGNYREEERSEHQTLVEAIQQMLLYWALSQGSTPAALTTAYIGNIGTFTAWLNSAVQFTHTTPTFPTPADAATGPDDPEYLLDTEGDNPFGNTTGP